MSLASHSEEDGHKRCLATIRTATMLQMKNLSLDQWGRGSSVFLSLWSWDYETSHRLCPPDLSWGVVTREPRHYSMVLGCETKGGCGSGFLVFLRENSVSLVS